MIVSHAHKFIFLKTRKTASTSVELALYGLCEPGDIVTPLTPTSLTAAVGHRAQNHIRKAFALDPRQDMNRVRPLEGVKAVDFHDHIRATTVRRYVGETVWNSYFKFAFGRNIYDRQVSWYHYRTRKHWKKSVWPTFDHFLWFSPEARIDNHKIYTIKGEVAVDFLGRYETLEADLARVMDTLNLPPLAPLARAKSGIRPGGRRYQDYYTPATRNMIARWYRSELALFGHHFEPPAAACA